MVRRSVPSSCRVESCAPAGPACAQPTLPVRGPGRPKGGYRNAAGERIPGSTTITGRFKDSGGLIRWAHAEGAAGRELYETRDAAGEAGSLCHDWIEDTLHGRGLRNPPEEMAAALVEQAKQGLAAFDEWMETVDLRVLETEQPLVSEEFQYGGTLDCLALVSGRKVLLDWKTSGGSYPDYIAQVASYQRLLIERDGPAEAPKSAFLLRIGKEHADFHFHSYPASVLALGWRWFLLARELYDLDKRLKKVAT